MARTQEGERLTLRHLANQQEVRDSLLADFAELFPGWSLDDPGSFDDVARAGAVLTREAHRTSAGLAADYFERFRAVEGVEGSASPVVVDPPSREEMRDAIRGAGLAGTVNARRRGSSMGAAMRNGLVKSSGAMGELALNGGRSTVLRSGSADRRATGYIRTVGGDPCAFCAMLASRGPVYRSSGGAMAINAEEGKTHAHCVCSFQLMYRDAKLPERNQHWQDQFNESQRQAREAGDLQRGTKNDSLNAFRRHIGKT